MIKKLAERFLRWYCRPEYHPDIRGDLEELYRSRLASSSRLRADLFFAKEVLLLLRFSLIKPIHLFNLFTSPIMITHNITVAYRHFLKNRFVSLIHILGLGIGMTTALLIGQYVYFEHSYDTFHEKADRIFRVRTDRIKDGTPFMQFAAGTACAGPLIKNNFPQVEDYVKLTGSSPAIYYHDADNTFKLEGVYYAMPSLFDIFSFPLVAGDPSHTLQEPFTACISVSLAKKMFGSADPIGKTITRNGTDTYQITGVFADPPSHSHLKFQLLLSYITYSDVFNQNGSTETSPTWDGFYTYLLLKPGTDWKALEANFPTAIENTFDEDMTHTLAFVLQPLKEIHLNSHYLLEAEANGDHTSVSLLLLIGIIVLLIAWFNFINLSTARASTRIKEVGIRKVVGSSKKNLVSQFLTEVILFNTLALIFALSLFLGLQGPFEVLIGKSVPLTILTQKSPLLILFTVFVLGIFISGIYPALMLSSFRPLQALKSGLINSSIRHGAKLRKGLVLVQFVASAGLIASTILIYHQLQFLQTTHLGVNLDQVLILRSPLQQDSTTFPAYQSFFQELESLSEVKETSSSTSIPGQPFGWTIGTVRRVGTPEDITRSFHAMAAEENYSTLYEMELAAGRHMDPSMSTDENACLLNETGAAKLDFPTPEAAIGKTLALRNGNQFTIVGVLKDFYQESPKAVIEPLLLFNTWEGFVPDFFTIKLAAQQLPQSLDHIEAKWGQFFSGNPFEYFFLDDHFNKQYAADQRFGNIFSLFSGLAIFVSCLGLFALIAFTVERKRKEIGIRKVLGAPVSGIVMLLTADLFRLVAIAILISTPIVWFFMNHWLENFTLRIPIQWWVFVLAGLGTLLITLLTASFHSLKAAWSNPVEAIRDE